MFRKLAEDHPKVRISFEGAEFFVDRDQSVASALIAEGFHFFRSSVYSQEPRGVFCMMGVCFECLLEINGRMNQQACLIPVSDNMVINRQTANSNGQP